jgi:FkbM family methyltransferase
VVEKTFEMEKLMRGYEWVRRAWFRLQGRVAVRMGSRQFWCDPENLNFWDKVNGGLWEQRTFTVLDRLLTSGTTYCDIGAWIGPTVLYAAGKCRQVYCLEPDRVAYRFLLENIQLNRLENVLPFNLALAAEEGLQRMASPRGKRGDSMTSLLLPEGARGMHVLCLTWDAWLGLIGRPVFNTIKMDIEGGEFSLLPTMSAYLEEHRPQLYLSLHPHLLPEAERLSSMARVVAALQMYHCCYGRDGEKMMLESLLKEQAVNRAGTYLLLPE